MRLPIAVLIALLVSMPAHASMTCQQALDMPVSEEAEDATASAGNIYGDAIKEIDGGSIDSPASLKGLLRNAGNKVPLISGGNFEDWDFAALDFPIPNVCFFQSNMKRSRWDEGKFPGIGLIEADLEGATFKSAKLDKVLLRQANLTNVSMIGARLREGLFDGGWGGSVENWDLSDADLRGFTFACGITVGDGCALEREGVKFTRADLTDADISTFKFWGAADYSGATLSNTHIAPSQLTEIEGAVIQSPLILIGGEEKIAVTAADVAELQAQHRRVAAEEDSPSFDCAKAMSSVEKSICGEYESELRRLDRQLATLYTQIKAKSPGIVADQKKWIPRRNRCIDTTCLDDLYRKRIATLMMALGEPQPLKPGETALYIDDTIIFPRDFHSTTLFRKITPALVGASMGEVLLSRNSDGSYDIDGESVGGNAHLCSVGGEDLRYNAKTGWFSGPNEDDPTKRAAVFRLFGDEIEFPGNGHPDDTEFPGSESYASCGARALLGTMTRIEASPELIAKRRAAFAGEND